MSDLYAVLDVPPDAPPDAIKSAYRRKARETHPDKPDGDADAFAVVAGAWLVLRDPERRARYDATGETEAPVDDRMARISQMLCAIFGQLLEQLDVDHTNMVDHTDMIGEMRRNLKEVKRRSVAAGKDIAGKLAKLEKARKRLKYSGKGGDFITVMLNDQLTAGRAQQRANAQEQDAADGAIEHLDGYRYDFEKRAAEPWGTTGTRLSDMLGNWTTA